MESIVLNRSLLWTLVRVIHWPLLYSTVDSFGITAIRRYLKVHYLVFVFAKLILQLLFLDTIPMAPATSSKASGLAVAVYFFLPAVARVAGYGALRVS